MINLGFALLLGIQAAATQPSSPMAEKPHPARPGMVYDSITDHYVPIIGWRAGPGGPHEVPKGTKLEYRRIGTKIGEAPIGR